MANSKSLSDTLSGTGPISVDDLDRLAKLIHISYRHGRDDMVQRINERLAHINATTVYEADNDTVYIVPLDKD